MLSLGIETSCDETAVALYCTNHGLLGHRVHSQTTVHNAYGGVVPELAARDHIQKLCPLLDVLLDATGVSKQALHGIAYTAGPGLLGALLVGAAFGRSLAYGLGIPAVAVHHMEGHLLAPMLEPEPPAFPFVALLVSGGHTLLVDVRGVGHYHILGDTLDDAAGEAFDKTAKLLGLDYPGGAALARLAVEGNPRRFRFPRPMLDRPGLDFSFSGLKTHALITLQNTGADPQTCRDIARAFEDAVVETLAEKCRRALRQTGRHRLVVAGGVSANHALRQTLQTLGAEEHAAVYFPRPEFCTDNAAMIAYAGGQRMLAGTAESLAIHADARWRLDQLTPP